MLRRLFCFILAAALMLTGCGVNLPFGGGNVEELLRAPQPGAKQSAVQKALNTYLGETAQLKYPRGGNEMSPMLFADLDGDADEEAALLYQSQSKGQNVHVAVLENKETGWEVTFEMEGLSTEVASVEQAELTGSGLQLVVCYANATLTDPYLSVYDYHDETVTRLYEQAYTQYCVADLDGTGVAELMLVTQGAQPRALTLQLLTAQEQTLKQTQTLLLDERFVTCQGLYVTASGTRRGLVVDGGVSGGAMASQMLRLTETGTLTQWPLDVKADVLRHSQRYLTGLSSADLDGEGTVEVPTDIAVAPTLTSARRFYFVTWRDFLDEEPEDAAQDTPPADARFGIYDSAYGYFMRLPIAWRGEVNLVDGTGAGEWNLRSKGENALLMASRIADETKPLGLYTPLAPLGEKSIQAYFTENCSADDARIIRRGIAVL